MKKLFYYETSIGKIGIAEEWGFITNICFTNMKQPINAKLMETDTIKEAYTQITEYLCEDRKEFDLPLNPQGTDFQQTVWSELLNIEYGQTKTYQEIAIDIGNGNASRAIGNAINKNPVPIIIPCHRVIGSNNKMVGYIGGIELKKKLLNLEKGILS